MPRTVTLKFDDGSEHVYQNVPDALTPSDVEGRAANDFPDKKLVGIDGGAKGSGVGAARMGSGAPATLGDTVGRVVRGLRDPVDALAQMAVRGGNAIGLVPDSQVKSVEGINKTAEEDYRKNWLGGNDSGFDLTRALGSGVVAGVATAPAKIAATMPGRILQGAKMGAGGALMTPVDDPKSNEDYFAKQGVKGLAGAAFGAAAVPAVEFGAQGVANLANSVAGRAKGLAKRLIGDTSDEFAQKTVSRFLASRGLAWGDLSEKVQKSLVDDVQEAMRKYGGVNSEAVGREADFRALGVNPLKAWVTRDPIDFGKTKNLEATDAGDVLKRARAELDATLIKRLESLRLSNTGSAYQSGKGAEEIVSGAHETAKKRVTSLYDAFRKTAPNVAADRPRLVSDIFDAVEKDALGGAIAGNSTLKGIMDDLASGKYPTTPDALFRLQQTANAIVRKGGPEGIAARKIVEGIDNELERMGSDMAFVGPEMKNAAALLKQARAAHRQLKMAEEAVPALKAVADGTFDAEKFLSRYVVGSSVDEVAAMFKTIKDERLRAAARSQIVDALKDAARGRGQADEAAVFSQANFSRFLGAPGMREKLQIILGDKGMKDVALIQRAAEAAIKVPAGARYNTSGSAMELLNLSRRIPVLGPMISDPLKGGLESMAASGMAKSGPQAMGTQTLDPMSEEILRRIRRGAGLLAAPAGAGGTNAVSSLLGYSN